LRGSKILYPSVSINNILIAHEILPRLFLKKALTYG
jgi:hypothetical protein